MQAMQVAMQDVCRLACLSAAALAAGACSAPAPPEEALRNWVAAAEAAVEDRDHGALLARVSPDYADARGNDRDAVGRTLRWWLLRQKRIGLLVDIDEMSVMRDSAAEVSLTVGMAAVNDRALGLSADAYRFELELEKRGDDWLLIGARWGELGQDMR